MKRFLTIFLLASLLSSCQLFDRLFNGEVVARLGNSVLHKSEIIDLIPKNSSPEDSARIVSRYIESWATKQLLLSMAENQLPKDAKDVDEELNDFRRSLLVFRYEKLFVEQRLDTLVTDKEREQYYKDHPQSFTAQVPIVKARYVKINSSSPNFQIIKTLYRSNMLEDIDQLEDLCYSSAEIYSNFNNEWVSLSVIAKELGMEISMCEEELMKKPYIEKSSMGLSSLVFVYDKVPSGAISPYDFNIEKIDEIIISKRKQELISNLERNLLEDAFDNNKLIIYN